MAGVAGTILAAYASMGIRIDYLLAASFMAAPGGILMAKIIMPDSRALPEGELPLGDVPDEPIAGEPLPQATHDEEKPANIIMAAAQGAQTGVKLAVAVGAMVLAFVALVALANGLLGGIGGWFGYPRLQLPGAARLCLRADHVPAQRAVERGAAIAGGLFGRRSCSTNSSPIIDLGAQHGALARARSRSSPSRCAASPISARSRSRWR